MNTIWSRLFVRIKSFDPVVLVRIYLLLFAGMTLLFEFLPFSPNQGLERWIMVGLFVVLFFLTHSERHVHQVLYAALFAAFVFIMTMIATTTGITSVDTVWLMVMGLTILFLIGIRAVLIWVVIVEIVLAVTYQLSLNGIWPSLITPSPLLTAYVLSSYLVALASIMLVLSLYDLQKRARIKTLDEGNRLLEEDYKSLVKSQRHKEEFVAAIGHELRTPMSAILGLNPLLREAVAHQPEWQAAVDHIRRSTQQLLGVVNNVLDHSQLQASRLFLMPSLVNVTDLMEEIQDEFRDRMVSNKLTLDCSIHLNVPKFLWLDRARFRQILVNLLDNAVKHSPMGSDMRVFLSLNGSNLHVEVHDRGPGLPKEVGEKLAQGTPLLPSLDHGHLTGAGLGLSICQALVKLHQGRMWAEAREVQGTCMAFEWPLVDTPRSTATQVQSDWVKLKQRPLQFLVVDDEPVNLVVVPMQIFKHMPNAEVQTANLSSVAMNKLTNNQFDVVILDMFMPDMSGQELTQWMRQSGHPHERTLVLALTASSNPDDWRACFQAGMNGVLVKPFDINELLNAIHSHNTRTTRKEA